MNRTTDIMYFAWSFAQWTSDGWSLEIVGTTSSSDKYLGKTKCMEKRRNYQLQDMKEFQWCLR